MNLILLQIWGMVRKLFTWSSTHTHATCYIALICIIAWLSWSKTRLSNSLDQLNNKNASVSLTNTQELKTQGNTVVYRDGNKIVKIYVPIEGGVTVSKQDKTGNETVVVKNKGLTVRIGAAVIYDGKMDGALDCKLAYWDRYSAEIGSSLTCPYISLSRHLDDLIPIIHPENVEIMLGYGKPYSNFSDSILLIGLRTNF